MSKDNGPGKFDTMLDAYVHDVSLLYGGCDDETGSVSEIGVWYGLMRHGSTIFKRHGSTIFKDHDPSTESLTEAERSLLTGSAGVIISEDAYGFVHVEYFDTMAALDTAWAEALKETAQNHEEAN